MNEEKKVSNILEKKVAIYEVSKLQPQSEKCLIILCRPI